MNENRTIQSSRKFDSPTLLIVTRGILRSREVCARPPTFWEMRMYAALSVYLQIFVSLARYEDEERSVRG